MSSAQSPNDDGVPSGTIVGVAAPPLAPTKLQPDRLPVGTELLGRYRVLERLGEGGMATVYRGVHTTIQKAVALKVLRDEYAARPDPVARFLQEARAASKIRQPNVVEISDFGETEDGLVFCVMEFLDGEDLAETSVREGALPWPRVCRMALQICAALQAAHDAGIVHRDLKPENCFRIKQGREHDFIKVLDFGIAHVVRGPDDEDIPGRRPRTAMGLIAGTPSYMSPEQARGAKIDARTDIYALGAMLFELLTARVPFEADSAAEILAMQLHSPIPDPRQLVPDIPDRLAALVMRSLAKDREERFADMAAVAVELESLYTELISVHDDPSTQIHIGGLSGTLRPTPRPRLSDSVAEADAIAAAEMHAETDVEDLASPPVAVVPQPRRGWLPWAIVAALVVGFGAFWLGRGAGDDPAEASKGATAEIASVTPPTAVETPPKPNPMENSAAVLGPDADRAAEASDSSGGTEPGTESGTESGAAAEVAAVDPVDPTVAIRFDTNVVASVYDDAGTLLGKTSDADGVIVPQSDDAMTLVLRRSGYRSERVTITPSIPSAVKAKLRRERKRPSGTTPKGDEPASSKGDDGNAGNKISEMKNPFDDG